ncbi:hypothetical protein IW140_002022 [Coemansia sp. RSA 1813]|nr:hypothetical protein IW140_002022 [Coemansia sp. RSA 1813]
MLNLVCSPSVVQNGTGLTSIGCSFTSKYELFLRIIEKSSSILESLEFEDDSLLNIRSLIFDEDYQPIVYPRLQRLDFSNKTGSMLDERLRVEKPIAPFPVLRHLKWNSMYVFEDDALFRGNSDTLEYMYIVVDTNLVDILQRHKVFCDGRYSQLCNVSVGMAEANDTRPLDTDVFLAFALRTIVPTTKALTLDLFDMFNIVDIASENQHLRNIQDLNLSGYIGSMRELIALIKLLPNMTKLTCNPEAIHLDPDSIQLSDLIDNLYTEYYPLSHRFRYWEVLVDSRQQVDHAATSALTFAILCTNFVLAYIPLGYREEFGQYIRNAIEGGQYDRHIDKIQRLFRILY